MGAVHRATDLPSGPGIGHLVVPASILRQTEELLRQAGSRKPAHEGMVWWVGRVIGQDTLVLSVVAPGVDSGPQHVVADELAVQQVMRAARRVRLGVVAQAHSHPGHDTRHSDGDDELILMPFHGMFSVVVARYGAGGMLPTQGASIHQFQHGRWVLLDDAETVLVVVPDEIRT